MRNFLNLLVICVLVFSCKKETKKIESATNNISEVIIEDDNFEMDSFNWDGSYVGILPCDSCKGINTEIILNLDHTYSFSKLFMGTDKPEALEKGNFIWLDDGCTIALDNNEKTKLKVKEDAILILKNNGEPHKNDKNYTLKKNICQEKDFEEFAYVNKDGKNFKVVFGKGCDGMFTEIKSENLSEYMLRSTASKTSTTYTNKNDFKLVDKGKIIVLYTPSQTIELTPKH